MSDSVYYTLVFIGFSAVVTVGAFLIAPKKEKQAIIKWFRK